MRCACLELMRLERISWFSFRFGTVVATRGSHYGIGGARLENRIPLRLIVFGRILQLRLGSAGN